MAHKLQIPGRKIPFMCCSKDPYTSYQKKEYLKELILKFEKLVGKELKILRKGFRWRLRGLRKMKRKGNPSPISHSNK